LVRILRKEKTKERERRKYVRIRENVPASTISSVQFASVIGDLSITDEAGLAEV
jgi:hypothetical protein